VKKRTAILLAAVLLLGSGAAAAGQALKDGCYNITLDAIRKELAAAGKFPAASEAPSAFYSDFFGLQRIRNLAKDDVLRIFVPRLAAPAAEVPVLKLRFAAGFTAAVHLDTEISIDGNRNGFRRSFVEFLDFAPAFKDRYAALADFLSLLESEDLAARFLEPNPYAALEKIAAADLKSETRPRSKGWPQSTPEERARLATEARAGFEKAGQAILMFGDTHGSEESFAPVWDFLQKHDQTPGFDWLGLEMLTRDEQPLLDAYIRAADDSAEFKAAEAKLAGIFRDGWDKRFAKPGDGHYWKLVQWARRHKMPVYALDAVADYNLFRYGEFPLGATTRNIIWAEVLPARGKGVVYGGSAHFVALPATPFTFQDYMKRKDPAIGLFLVR
jgi:hypothetical protein